jgi:hypothetical protein
MASRLPLPHVSQRRTVPSSSGRRAGLAAIAAALLVTGCNQAPSAESQRIEQLELKIQQLEQRLNRAETLKPDAADKAGKPPAGPVKSLTFRTGTDDDRLRIYWADGSSSDLPCTREQATYVCG